MNSKDIINLIPTCKEDKLTLYFVRFKPQFEMIEKNIPLESLNIHLDNESKEFIDTKIKITNPFEFMKKLMKEFHLIVEDHENDKCGIPDFKIVSKDNHKDYFWIEFKNERDSINILQAKWMLQTKSDVWYCFVADEFSKIYLSNDNEKDPLENLFDDL